MTNCRSEGGAVIGWRDEPITVGQRKYIESILEFCEWPLPPIDLKNASKGEASRWLDENLSKAYELMYNPHEDAGDRI